MRVVVFGNSGSGKSTLAKALVKSRGLGHLDLDTIAWKPEGPIERAPLAESTRKIDAFTAINEEWVIEGCYADLIAHAALGANLLLFLDPGVEACLENCRNRPFEPHKYPSKEAQDNFIDNLLKFVREYDERDDAVSRKAQERLFQLYAGRKIKLTSNAEVNEYVAALRPHAT